MKQKISPQEFYNNLAAELRTPFAQRARRAYSEFRTYLNQGVSH